MSKLVGAVLMVLIVIMLVSLMAVTMIDFAATAEDQAKVHAIGSYNFDHQEADGDTLTISPDAADTENAQLVLEINGHRVHTWDGQDPLEMTCLYPGDHLEIISKKDDSTTIVDDYRMVRSTKCTRIRALPKKFEYAYIDYDGKSKKVKVQPEYTFGIEIDPDGPGNDGDFGHDTFKQDIGTVPVTNEWHYIRRYDKAIEGFEPPVWVIVMTDNVHWKDTAGASGLNWTDEPAGEPGIDSYEINGNSLTIKPSGSEPTNDVYIVFKPGCSASEMKIINVDAGYHNRIYLNGKVAIGDTFDYSEDNPSRTDPPVTITAPGVNCPGR